MLSGAQVVYVCDRGTKKHFARPGDNEPSHGCTQEEQKHSSIPEKAFACEAPVSHER